MDVPLKFINFKTLGQIVNVSILVLMDVPLKSDCAWMLDFHIYCFNPCSHGCAAEIAFAIAP